MSAIFKRGGFGRHIQWGKHCFMYCGKERCDCGASATPEEREEHDKELELNRKLNRAHIINGTKE